MKLAAFLITRSRRIFTKLLAFSKRSVKINVRLHWTLFVILLTYLQTKTFGWK